MLRLGPERAATRAAMTSAAPQNPIAVLVEREGLGDVLLKLPLLRAIARGFPNTPIWWISTHQTDLAGSHLHFMPG